jgi:hypothetical protein
VIFSCEIEKEDFMKKMRVFSILMTCFMALSLIFASCEFGDNGDNGENGGNNNTGGNETGSGDDGTGNGGGTNGGNSGGSGSGGAGSTRSNAKSVTVGNSSSHTISLNGEHWFKFAADGNPVIFETTGNVVDTYMFVAINDSTFGYVSDDSGEGSNALFSYASTNPGSTYFIRITTRNQTSGTYSLLVKQPTANIRTNPIAVSLGNSSSHTINSSSTHWFKFEGTGDRVFFETEGNVVRTKMSIFVGDNTSSSYSNADPISFFTVSGTTYYISITGNAGTYTFNVRYGDGDGSSRYNAKTVTVGNSTSHNINLNGVHWFTFFGTGNPVTFETTGDVVDTYMFVAINDSTFGHASDDHTTGNLNARVRYNPSTLGATYFIQITQRQSTQGTYTFVVKAE